MTRRRVRDPFTNELGYRVDGGIVPTVTTVLDVLAKPGLEKWKRARVAQAAIAGREWRELDDETAERVLLETANSFTRTAALRGTAIHKMLENVEGPIAELDPASFAFPEHAAYLEAAAPIADALDYFRREVTLYSTEHRFAGTADVLSWVEDRRGAPALEVLDWKTVDSPEKSVGWSDHVLQLSALAACDRILEDDGSLSELPAPIVRVSVAGLKPDGSSEFRSTDDPIRIREGVETFVGALGAYRFLRLRYPRLSYWQNDEITRTKGSTE